MYYLYVFIYIFIILICFFRLIAYFGEQISYLLSVEWHLLGKQNLSSKRTRVAIMNRQNSIDTLGCYYYYLHF